MIFFSAHSVFLMCQSIPAASILPRANPGHFMHDESRGPGIWQLIVSRPPGHLQTPKILFRNILSSFSMCDGAQSQRFQAVKHCHFGVGEEHLSYIDHKRPLKAIKPFALSFFCQSDSFRSLFYAVLLN